MPDSMLSVASVRAADSALGDGLSAAAEVLIQLVGALFAAYAVILLLAALLGPLGRGRKGAAAAPAGGRDKGPAAVSEVAS